MKPGDQSGNLKWDRLGRPKGGTVNAVALTNQPAQAFLGTEIGIYLLDLSPAGKKFTHRRLSSAPIGVLSLAVSPNFIEDQTIAAGTNTGIYISRDGGESWKPGKHALPDLAVLSICFSPAYRSDGLILAGSLQDGVLVSGDRGNTWHTKNFGLLDSLVYCVSISPHFEADGVVFAGTETALYYSYNRARAWKMLNFPVEASPVLSLTLSPYFASDGVIFAGTETNGLFRSSDQGETWQRLSFPAECVNALSFTSDQAGLMAGTDQGLYRSNDGRESWELSLDLPNVMSIGFGNRFSIAAAFEEGLWGCPAKGDWFHVENLALKAMEGVVLSSQFLQDRTAYLYGASEGIWKTEDGGDAWDQIVSGGLDAKILDLTIQSHDTIGHVLAFASDAGVFTSADGGHSWTCLDNNPAEMVCYSSDGSGLSTYGLRGGLRFSMDGGENWQTVSGPWDEGGKILTIDVSSTEILYIAYQEGNGDVIHILRGVPGRIEQKFKIQAIENPVVSFWIPNPSSLDSEWYFSVGDRVYRLHGDARFVVEETRVTVADDQVNLLDLKGVVSGSSVELYALSNHNLFLLNNDAGWKTVCDFGIERAVALSSIFQLGANHMCCILFVGGELHQVTLVGHGRQESSSENLQM